jgi:hypothetical protein
MRTKLDIEEMARLALQVHERGLDGHQPIVAADNGDGTYRVVSGHRRRVAALLAEEVKARANGGDVDLDFVHRVVCEFATRTSEVAVCTACGAVVEDLLEGPDGEAGFCPECEDLMEVRVEERGVPSPSALTEAHVPLSELHGDVVVPFALFEGDEKEEILLLQASNFGQEKPDLWGEALSYRAALKLNTKVSVEEIAANTGQPVARIKAVVALTRVPGDLVEAIIEEEVALGVAGEVARLRKKAQREGTTRYILWQGRCKVETVAQIVREMREWQPPSVSLDPEMTPKERNEARLLEAAWGEVEKKDPAEAWFAAARAIAGGGMRLHHLGLDGDEREWLHELVPGARCEECRLGELLREAPDFGYPRYPCQQEEEPGCCFDGVFGQDPFLARVPFGWQGYPGVEMAGAGRRYPVCLRADAFREALAAAVAEREADGEDGEDNERAGVYDYAGYARPAKVGNVARQRELIRSYMETHAQMSGANHPLATRCAECAFRLDQSPTKNPSVPHCQWAARRRNVEFWVRVPSNGDGVEIPLCRQYGPARSWDESVPEHPAPPGVPREWMVGLIEDLVESVERRAYSGSEARLVCEMLTGRPLRSSESHKGRFAEGLEAEVGNLSDGQLWMLLMWVAADWMQTRKKRYLLPMPSGQVIEYREEAWPLPPEAGEEEAS